MSVTPPEPSLIVPANEIQESSLEIKELGKSSAPVLPGTSLFPPIFRASADFWPKSILTFNNLMNNGSTTKAPQALEPQKLKTDVMEPVQFELFKIKKEMTEPEVKGTGIIEENKMKVDIVELDAPFKSVDNNLKTKEAGKSHLLCKLLMI